MEQQQLEQNFQKNSNIFFETINKRLLNEKEQLGLEAFNQKYLNILNTIQESSVWNFADYETVGTLSYLVGIGYVNQQYLDENICKQVSNRFKVYEFSEEVISKFIFVLNNLKDIDFSFAKAQMQDEIKKQIEFKQPKPGEKPFIKELFINIKAIINHSIIPINLVVPTYDIIQKKENISYQELLTINNFLNTTAKFIGKTAIKNFMKIYGSEDFVNILNSALKMIDNQKFALIYQDSILSLKESLSKFNSDMLYAVILDKTSEFNWEQFKDEFENNKKETSEQKEEVIKYERKPKDVIDNLMVTNPAQFIFECFGDYTNLQITTAEQIADVIDKISEDEDYGHHIYQYLKVHKDKLSKDNYIVENNLTKSIISLLETKTNYLQEEYKNLIELICAPIPEKVKERLSKYILDTIETCILETEDTKQYLISQYIEPGIDTYNHLQEIVSLIETCSIVGVDMISYYTLHKYLKENTLIEDTFAKINKKPFYENKLAIYYEFANYFKTLDSLE